MSIILVFFAFLGMLSALATFVQFIVWLIIRHSFYWLPVWTLILSILFFALIIAVGAYNKGMVRRKLKRELKARLKEIKSQNPK